MKNSKLKHSGKTATKSEDMSPTVERLAVLRWMELIHPKIPALVQRTFAYDLQRSTLRDLQPQIADAIDGFLEEINQEECKIDRAQATFLEDEDEDEAQVHRSFVAGRGYSRGRPFKSCQHFNKHKAPQRGPAANYPLSQPINS